MHRQTRTVLLAAALLLCIHYAAAQNQPKKSTLGNDPSLAFTHVNVIDVERGQVLRDRTVLIVGNRIEAIGRTASIHVPTGAHVVVGQGKYLIPGLWDFHAHGDAQALSLYVANGVTGVRMMAGSPNDLSLRDELRRGARVGPRMVVGTPLVDGPKPVLPQWSVAVKSPAEASAAVDALHTAGYDFLKVYSAVPRDVYLAIAEQARERRMPFAGHLPTAVPITEAVSAGQASFEHLIGLQLACSRDEDQVRRALLKMYSRASSEKERIIAMLATYYEPVPSFDAARCESVLHGLARAGAWQVPTLVTFRALAAPLDSAMWADPRLRYRSPAERQQQLKLAELIPSEGMRRAYQNALPLVRQMYRAGVPLLAGSDAPTLYVSPGFSLHEELALLVQAGLTPLDALRTATLNPARYLHMTDSLGTLAPGKLADVLLLDANPLSDIRNTQKISAVVLNGRYLDHEELKELLAETEQQANASDLDHLENMAKRNLVQRELSAPPLPW